MDVFPPSAVNQYAAPKAGSRMTIGWFTEAPNVGKAQKIPRFVNTRPGALEPDEPDISIDARSTLSAPEIPTGV